MEPAEVITRFYTAFAAGDADAMAACYTADVQFQDPAFGVLRGPEVMAMWRMLLERSKGQLQLTLHEARSEGDTGHATWEARYPFGPNRRPVVNTVQATFAFREGKISNHQDDFSFRKWARQALGVPGWVLGGTSYLRRRVQKQTHHMLRRYMEKHGG